MISLNLSIELQGFSWGLKNVMGVSGAFRKPQRVSEVLFCSVSGSFSGYQTVSKEFKRTAWDVQGRVIEDSGEF